MKRSREESATQVSDTGDLIDVEYITEEDSVHKNISSPAVRAQDVASDQDNAFILEKDKSSKADIGKTKEHSEKEKELLDHQANTNKEKELTSHRADTNLLPFAEGEQDKPKEKSLKLNGHFLYLGEDAYSALKNKEPDCVIVRLFDTEVDVERDDDGTLQLQCPKIREDFFPFLVAYLKGKYERGKFRREFDKSMMKNAYDVCDFLMLEGLRAEVEKANSNKVARLCKFVGQCQIITVKKDTKHSISHTTYVDTPFDVFDHFKLKFVVFLQASAHKNTNSGSLFLSEARDVVGPDYVHPVWSQIQPAIHLNFDYKMDDYCVAIEYLGVESMNMSIPIQPQLFFVHITYKDSNVTIKMKTASKVVFNHTTAVRLRNVCRFGCISSENMTIKLK